MADPGTPEDRILELAARWWRVSAQKLARDPMLGYCLHMNYPVVPFAESHIESFRDVLDAVARERLYIAMLEAPPLEEVRRFVQGNIRDGRPGFVALDGDRVIGWCDIHSLRRPLFAHSGELGMGVLNAYRGQGVGKALLGAALNAAKAAGLTRVELSVREPNLRALRLYETMGFVVEGVKRRGVRLDGNYEDLICIGYLIEA
jgi:RimJ/RimL family protein N-acetyltransferase